MPSSDSTCWTLIHDAALGANASGTNSLSDMLMQFAA